MSTFTPQRWIWVSTAGKFGAAGTQQDPLRSIQDAVKIATPGTAIMVRAGTYSENIEINGGVNLALNNLTANRGLALISADGEGRAIIRSANWEGAAGFGKKSTIFIASVGNVKIDGFEIQGNTSKANGVSDGGPIKIIGGLQTSDAVGNYTITNNKLSGTGVDGLKLAMTHTVHIANNVFTGRFDEETLDNVTVWNARVVSNDIFGYAPKGAVFKTGSQNIVVENNHFSHGNAENGLYVGGVGFSQLERPPLPSNFRGFEAKNMTVRNNVFESGFDGAVKFFGGQYSTLSNNAFLNPGQHAVRSVQSWSPPDEPSSRSNTIVDNIVAPRLTTHVWDQGQAFDYKVWNNFTGGLANVRFAYGADAFGGGVVAPPPPPPPPPPPGDDDGVLVVRAGGTGLVEAPKFRVFADGVLLGDATVSNPINGAFNMGNAALYRDYVFDLGGASPKKIDIEYVNDGIEPSGLDRNLFVDYIDVDGLRRQSETDGFFVSRWVSALNGPRQDLVTNGVLTFGNLPTSGGSTGGGSTGGSTTGEHVIAVKAGGIGATGPAFRVLADGKVIGEARVTKQVVTGFDVNNDSLFETFVFKHAGAAPRSVVVQYYGDGWDSSPRVNRDLAIDYIAVNGRIYESETAGRFDPLESFPTLEGPREMLHVNGDLRFDTL